MSLWTRFLDWLFGVEVMTMDDLRSVETAVIDCLNEQFRELNERIDQDENGRISVREAVALIKTMLTTTKRIIKKVI